MAGENNMSTLCYKNTATSDHLINVIINCNHRIEELMNCNHGHKEFMNCNQKFYWQTVTIEFKHCMICNQESILPR